MVITKKDICLSPPRCTVAVLFWHVFMAICLSVLNGPIAVAQFADVSDLSCVYLSICPLGGLWLSHTDFSTDTDVFFKLSSPHPSLPHFRPVPSMPQMCPYHRSFLASVSAKPVAVAPGEITIGGTPS